jgi:hypothetical protein
MKVGDLVTVGPAGMGHYIITSLTVKHLPDCVMLVSLESQAPGPMARKWIIPINEIE